MTPFYFFFALLVLFVVGAAWFLNSAWASIRAQAGEHAKTYAIAYVKGGSLIVIAGLASFEQAYWALDETYRTAMEWAVYFIFFSKTLTGGLAVLVAFLDRSVERANVKRDAKESASNPPFPPRT